MAPKPKRDLTYHVTRKKESFFDRYKYRLGRGLLLLAAFLFLGWYFISNFSVSFVQTTITGGLISILLGFLAWYLGFNPSSTTLLPLIYGKPYKIYFYNISTTDQWAHFLINKIGKFKKLLTRYHYPDLARVSLNKRVHVNFDVENIAKFSQIDLVELNLKVSRRPILDEVDVLRVHPGLGGGAIRKYGVVVNYDYSPGAPEAQTLSAKLSTNSEAQFIKLNPGERESFELEAIFTEPGIYHVIPIAVMRFREAEYKHHFYGEVIVVPVKAYIWDEAGLEEFKKTPYEINLINGELQLRGMVITNPETPIICEMHYKDIEAGIFVVWENAIVSKSHAFGITQPKEHLQEYFPSEKVRFLEASYGELGGITVSPSGKYTASLILNKGLTDRLMDRLGKPILINNETLEITKLDAATDWCQDLVWSPNSNRLAYICRFKHTAQNGHSYLSDRSELWIYDVLEGRAFPILKLNGIENPHWSRDEKKILLGGNGLYVVELDTPNSFSTMVGAEFGARFYHPYWAEAPKSNK